MRAKLLPLYCVFWVLLSFSGSALQAQTGGFVYVTTAVANQPGAVSGYSIDGKTGAITAIPGSPFPAGLSPFSVAVHPTGEFAYVANAASNDISAYRIDGATGALTPVLGSPFAAGAIPVWVTIDPEGRFAYFANAGSGSQNGDSISAYAIDAITGGLHPLSGVKFPPGYGASSATVDTTGKFLYATSCQTDQFGFCSAGTNVVFAYSIDRTLGTLTPVAGSPFPAGSTPRSIAADPTGRFLFVGNYFGTSVSSYIIDANTGALTTVPGSPFQVGPYPNGITEDVAVDHNGRFVYVATNGGSLVAFSIDRATGTLTPIPGSPFAGQGYSSWSVSVEPTGKFLYLTNAYSHTGSGGNVSAYAIDQNSGALTPVAGSPWLFPPGVSLRSVATTLGPQGCQPLGPTPVKTCPIP
jgi:6-phosphogluconolactonase